MRQKEMDEEIEFQRTYEQKLLEQETKHLSEQQERHKKNLEFSKQI
jgi:hypothetical protein